MGMRRPLWRALFVLATYGLCCTACGEEPPKASALEEPPAEPQRVVPEVEDVDADVEAPVIVVDDPFESPNHVFRRKLKKGQTLNPILRRYGLSPKQAIELVAVLKPLINLDRRVRPGDNFSLAVNDEGDVVAFDFRSRRDGDFFVRRQGDVLKAAKDTPPELRLPREDPALQSEPIAENTDPGPGSRHAGAGAGEGEDGAGEVDQSDDEVIRRDEAPAVATLPTQDAPTGSKEEGDTGALDAVAETEREGEAEADANTVKDGPVTESGAEELAGGSEGVAPVEKSDGLAEAPSAEGQPKGAPKSADAAKVAEKAKDPRQKAREARRKAQEDAAARRQARLHEREQKIARRKAKREEVKRKAIKEKIAAAKAAKRERERLEAEQERLVAQKSRFPKNPVSLVKAYFETNDAARKRVIAKRLNRKGVRATRKALVRAFRAGKAPTGLQIKKIKVNGKVGRYAVYVPKSYKPGRSYPLHISLHGGGGNGPATCQRRWGDDWPNKFILVCPSTPAGHWWQPQGEATILAVYREVLRDYHVQTDQVSVGGLSNGGTGTFHMATKYPWLWAAVIPRCSARFAFEDWYENMVSLPAFVIHGGRDHQIVPSNSRWIVDKLKKLGNKADYIEVADGGHDFFSELNPKVVRWMLPKKRKKSIGFEYNRVRGADPELIYWLSARGAGDIKATMQRKGATTVVKLTTSRQPKHLKVYFPKGFESKTTRVLLNGKVVFSGKTRITAHNVLESFAKTGDLRRVYSGSVEIL